MANLQELRSHIRSVTDTKKITTAMYFISSTKLRRAREELETTRPYFDALHSEIKRIFRTVDEIDSPYFYPKGGGELPPGGCACLVLTADKGLAGDYNMGVIRQALALLEKEPDTRLYVAGEMGRRYLREHGIPFEEDFTFSCQNPTLQTAREITARFLPDYQQRVLTRVFIIYTDLKNSLRHAVVTDRLLPFHHDRFVDPPDYERPVTEPFEFSPSVEEVLHGVIPIYLIGYVYSALVDSYCSEQNARMIAMKAAGENADRLLQSLASEYNRARQNKITQELTELSSGARVQRMKHRLEGRT